MESGKSYGRRRKESRHVRAVSAPAARRYLVFITHSTGDTWIARAIAHRIRQQGGDVWLDVNELAGGDAIYQKILKAVDACDEAIVLLSPHSVSSQWVLFEIGALCGQHKRVTPILSYIDSAAIPILPWIKAVELNQFDQLFLPELARRIRRSPH